MARALTLAASLALAGLVVAITAFVTTRAGVTLPWPLEAPPADDAPRWQHRTAPAGLRRAGELRRRSAHGRRLSVEEAMRELDLVKPPRARAAEDFTLPMPDGRQFRLSEHRGKVVFINFWATWCPPCREEMPSMERLYVRQRDRRFTMVAVSLDSNPTLVAPYFKQSGLTFPVVLDPRMDLANSYGVRALPASFIVDPHGTLVAMALGPRAWDGPAAHALMEGVAR